MLNMVCQAGTEVEISRRIPKEVGLDTAAISGDGYFKF